MNYSKQEIVLCLLKHRGYCGNIVVDDCAVCVCHATCKRYTKSYIPIEDITLSNYNIALEYLNNNPGEFLDELL